MVFSRFDKFQHRVNMVAEFFRDSRQMMLLEKVEIGGIQGNRLTAGVVSIYEEFLELHAAQSAITYDPLNPENNKFDADFSKFKV